jgi:hypothetical protein
MQRATLDVYTFYHAVIIGAPNLQRSFQRIYNSPDLAPIAQACAHSVVQGIVSPRTGHLGALSIFLQQAALTKWGIGSLAASYRAFKIRLRG